MDESKSKVFCSAEYCLKLKELLKAAMADLEEAEDCDSCIYAYSPTGLCPANSENGKCEFKWKHHDEAMQLLGEEE